MTSICCKFISEALHFGLEDFRRDGVKLKVRLNDDIMDDFSDDKLSIDAVLDFFRSFLRFAFDSGAFIE